MKKYILFIILLFCFISYGYSDMVSIYAENDVMFQNDYYYTHGTEIAYKHQNIEYSLVQTIYTPEIKTTKVPIDGDRPYAGLLYIGVNKDYNFRWLDNIEYDLGVIGPWSRSEQSQKIIHKWIHSGIPEGWDSQVKNQPVISITLHKGIYLLDNDYFNIYPYYRTTFGTVQDSIIGGNRFLLGYNVKEFKNNQIVIKNVQKKNWVAYVFAGGEARYVGYNSLLEDSIFYDDDAYYTVETKRTGLNFEYGACISYKNTGITFTTDYMSKEFRTQEESFKSFNSIKLFFNF